MAALTPKQARFVDEYLVDLNATEAAKRAGYSAKTAHSSGPRLLANVGIKKALAARAEKTSEKLELTAEWVIKRAMLIADANMKTFGTWNDSGVSWKQSSEITDEQAYAVAEVSQIMNEYGGTTKFKLHDKVKALEMLARHLGLFVDKVEVTGHNGGPIEVSPIDLDKLSVAELQSLRQLASKASS